MVSQLRADALSIISSVLTVQQWAMLRQQIQTHIDETTSYDSSLQLSISDASGEHKILTVHELQDEGAVSQQLEEFCTANSFIDCEGCVEQCKVGLRAQLSEVSL